MAAIELPQPSTIPANERMPYERLLDQRYQDIGYVLAKLDRIIRVTVFYPNLDAQLRISTFRFQHN